MAQSEQRPSAVLLRDARRVAVSVPALGVALFAWSCHNGEASPSRSQVIYGRQTAFGDQPSEKADGGDRPTASSPLGQVAPFGLLVSTPAAAEDILAGALGGSVVTAAPSNGGELGPIEHGIEKGARARARDMTAVGDLMFARLTADGHARGALTMQPGVCYTIVGFGGSGVVELALNLLTSPPIPPQILAQSVPGDATAVIGGDGQCVRSRYAIPFDVGVDLHVVRGQGAVGARVYQK